MQSSLPLVRYRIFVPRREAHGVGRRLGGCRGLCLPVGRDYGRRTDAAGSGSGGFVAATAGGGPGGADRNQRRAGPDGAAGRSTEDCGCEMPGKRGEREVLAGESGIVTGLGRAEICDCRSRRLRIRAGVRGRTWADRASAAFAAVARVPQGRGRGAQQGAVRVGPEGTGRLDVGRPFAGAAEPASAQIHLGPGDERRMKNDKPKVVVLLSGGMDSCVCAALAVRDFEPAFLHFDYGQRTAARERQAFHAIANHYSVGERLVVETDFFRLIGGSALSDAGVPVPEDGLNPNVIPVTYVPLRNAHLLAAGVSWAEVKQAESVMIGAVAPDSSGYPDCRPAYYEAFNRLLEVGTKQGRVRVVTPLLRMSKAEIVRLGHAE